MNGSEPCAPVAATFDAWQLEMPRPATVDDGGLGGAIVGFSFSLETGSVAVRANDGRVFERTLEGHRSHAIEALPAVAELMAQAAVRPADVIAVAADAGPGGFTGLRTACGLAQGLAVGWQVPCVSVSSLSLMAWAALRTHGGPAVCMTVLDARQQEVYAAAWVQLNGGVQILLAPSLLPYGADPRDVLVRVAAMMQGSDQTQTAHPDCSDLPLLVVGPGAVHLRLAGADLAIAASPGATSTEPDRLPTAGALVELAAQAVASHATVPPAACQPLYVRHQVALTTAQRQQASRV